MHPYRCYIDGQWCAGATGKTLANTNPARPKEILGEITLGSAADVTRAVDAAERALPEWARLPRPARGAFLQKLADLMKTQVEELGRLLTQEEGKNLNEAKGEVLKAINVLEFTASEARRPVGQVIPSDMANTFIYTTRSPMGVVGLITPWNFPVCIPIWKIAPALVEGNTVVFKPAEQTPATATRIVELFEKVGLPKGVLNLVHGEGPVVGAAIVADPRIKVISFTGSNEVGRLINEQAAKRLARVQLEMGGKNPVIVLADADIDQAAEASASGAFGSTGQRCTATSRVIVDRKVHRQLADKIAERAKKITTGNGLENPSAMGPVVDEEQFNKVLKGIDRAKKDGAKLLCGGTRMDIDGGYFIAPTVFDEVSSESLLAQEELFGPVLAIIPVDGIEEAFRVTNHVKYGLSSSIYTKDYQSVMKYADQIETGMLHVNSPTVGGEAQAPFGGVKETGLGGREMGATANEIFCEIKTVYFDYNTTVRKGNTY